MFDRWPFWRNWNYPSRLSRAATWAHVGPAPSLGSATSKATDSSISITLVREVRVGQLVLVYISMDSAENFLITSVVDSRGNTYQLLDSGFAYNATFEVEEGGGSIYGAMVATALQIGDTITVSYPSTAVTKVLTADAFDGYKLDGFDAGIGTIDVDTAPHSDISGWDEPDPAGLLIAMLTVTGPDTDSFTDDSDSLGGDTWHRTTVGTNGGAADTNLTQHRVYKRLVPPHVDQLYNPTLGTVRPWLDQIVGLLDADTLGVKDALHAHAAENVLQNTDLVIQDALHGHTADELTLVQQHNLTIQDALHSHAADNLALTQIHVLAINDALHGHAADNLALTQVHVLVVQDALHAHAADNLTLTESGATDLVIQDALHSHSAEGLTLTQVHVLVIQDASHAHAGDSLVLTQVHNLAIQDALHAHLGDNVVLSVPGGGPAIEQHAVRLRRRGGIRSLNKV